MYLGWLWRMKNSHFLVFFFSFWFGFGEDCKQEREKEKKEGERESLIGLLAEAKRVKDLFRGKRNLTSTPNIENMELIAFQSGSDTNMQFRICSGGPPSFSRQSGTVIIMVTTLLLVMNIYIYIYVSYSSQVPPTSSFHIRTIFISCFWLSVSVLVFSTEEIKRKSPNKACNFINSVSRDQL